MKVLRLVIVAVLPFLVDGCGKAPCQKGCYDGDNDGKCEWAPTTNTGMYECPPGTYSPVNSSECTPCDPGHYSFAAGSGGCYMCAPGQYAPGYGSVSCLQCSTSLYFGPGAHDVLVDGSEKVCLMPDFDKTPAPSSSFAPSQSPSATPTQTPTRNPTVTPSELPSTAPVASPSIAPTATRVATVAPTMVAPSPTKPPNGAEPVGPTMSPTRYTKQEKRSTRSEAFWMVFPLLAAALVIVIVAVIVQRNRPKKTRRPKRPVPLPPPSMEMEKDTTMTAGEDDSVADMYFDEDLESYRMDDVSLT